MVDAPDRRQAAVPGRAGRPGDRRDPEGVRPLAGRAGHDCRHRRRSRRRRHRRRGGTGPWRRGPAVPGPTARRVRGAVGGHPRHRLGRSVPRPAGQGRRRHAGRAPRKDPGWRRHLRPHQRVDRRGGEGAGRRPPPARADRVGRRRGRRPRRHGRLRAPAWLRPARPGDRGDRPDPPPLRGPPGEGQEAQADPRPRRRRDQGGAEPGDPGRDRTGAPPPPRRRPRAGRLVRLHRRHQHRCQSSPPAWPSACPSPTWSRSTGASARRASPGDFVPHRAVYQDEPLREQLETGLRHRAHPRRSRPANPAAHGAPQHRHRLGLAAEQLHPGQVQPGRPLPAGRARPQPRPPPGRASCGAAPPRPSTSRPRRSTSAAAPSCSRTAGSRRSTTPPSSSC